MAQAAREVHAMIDQSPIDEFLSDRLLLRATERCIEIIGESARRVSAGFQSRHPEIPWRNIIGQRNILAHEYGQIDHELLYHTAIEDIPILIQQLEALLPPLETNQD